MSGIAKRLDELRERVAAAARAAGRSPETVRVLAVSKRFAPECVREAVAAGQTAFGENRVQEGVAKREALDDLPDTVEWHLIGSLQRNKVRRALEHFDVIQSVDRPELVDALAKAASSIGVRRRVMLQVDVDDEPQKGVVAPHAAPALLEAIDATSELEATGLMAIPATRARAEDMRPAFARLRELRDELARGRPPGHALDELSMGMSADFEIAIAEGATWVRLGTAIFGPREAP